jgi:riboflavin kinase/FMN adenylyltransferase
MRVFRSAGEVPADFGPSVVTIGNFDGVHAGHRQILRRVASLAREHRLTPTVMTFDPHPALVLAPDRAPRLLMTIDQRLRSMEAEGIEAVLLIPFSMEFAGLTPDEFVEQVLVERLKARIVLVGEDFRFGYKQAGDIGTLRELGARLGFEVEPVAGIMRRGERISSTKIRALVGAGGVSRACRLLGMPFALEGPVVKGQGIGAKQTVPTLNLEALNEVLPKTGVYVTRARDLDSGRLWNSITNVGYRPTFGGDALTVETFLLGPLGDSTPQRIEVEFLFFVREERKFSGPEELKAQILRDAGVANRLHRRLAWDNSGLKRSPHQ